MNNAKKVKLKYTLKVIAGLVFLVLVIALIYWLIFQYKVQNFFAWAGILLFLITPAFIAITKIPNEIRGLVVIWSSENPEEIEKVLGDMRERGHL